MTDNLRNLWSEDPPRREQTSETERVPLTNLWDEHEAGSSTESTGTTTEPHERLDRVRLWSPPAPAPASTTSPPTTNGRARIRAHEAVRRARRRRARRRRKAALLVGGLLLLALIVDTAWAALTLSGGLRTARSELAAGISTLQAGELAAARDHFNKAREEAGSASEGLDHPSMRLASVAPAIERDMDVLRSLSSASEIASRAGVTVVSLAEDLGVTSDGFASSLYSDGRVNLDALEQGRPLVEEIAARLAEAESQLDEAPEASLAPLDDAHGTALGEISDASDTARKSAALFGALPTLLGQDTEQRYFLAFQSLSEARGTGGLIGLYGVLSASDGVIELKRVAPISDLILTPIEPVSGPVWFAERYEPFASLEQWQQVNMTPNLPAASEVLLDMYEAARGRRLDGVVAMDPIALGMISSGTGPLQGEGLELAITEANAKEVLHRTVYEEFPDSDEQNVFLADLITEFWGRLEEGDVHATGLLSGLGRAVSTRHLSVYSADAEAESALVETEAAGSYDSYGPNVQMVFHDNLGANKVDYFLKRRIDTSIEIEENGDALVTTSVRVSNDSLGEPVLVEGIEGDPPNFNRMFLNAILPQGAQVQSLTVDGEFRSEVPDNEDGFPAVWDIIGLEPGARSTMVVEYRLPNVFNTSAERGGFDMTLIPQTSATPDRFSLEVIPPDGFAATIEDHHGEGEPATSVGGKLDSVRTFEFLLRAE